jgi:hypothetical protein
MQSKGKSLEVTVLKASGGLGLVDVSWLCVFNPVWSYEVKGE